MIDSKKLDRIIERLDAISPSLINSWDSVHMNPEPLRKVAGFYPKSTGTVLLGLKTAAIFLLAFIFVTVGFLEATLEKGARPLPDSPFRVWLIENNIIIGIILIFIGGGLFILNSFKDYDLEKKKRLYRDLIETFMDAAERLLEGFHGAGLEPAKDNLSSFHRHVDLRLVSLAKAFLPAEKECRNVCHRPIPDLREVNEKLIIALLAKKSLEMHFQAAEGFGLEPSWTYTFSWAKAELANP